MLGHKTAKIVTTRTLIFLTLWSWSTRSPQGDEDRQEALLKAAEVRDGRLLDGIRTLPTTSIEQGVDARIVVEILGHSQISLTQNTYQHVMPAVIADATERVARVLFAPTATTTAPQPGKQEAP